MNLLNDLLKIQQLHILWQSSKERNRHAVAVSYSVRCSGFLAALLYNPSIAYDFEARVYRSISKRPVFSPHDKLTVTKGP